MVKHRDRQLRNSWVAAVEADDKEVHAAAQDLLRTATERVDVVLAAEAAHVHVLHGVLDGWLRSGGGTVRTRMLCAQNTVDWGFVQRHVRDGNPLEVRVARIPLLAALIVDGRAALVCADSAAGGAPPPCGTRGSSRRSRRSSTASGAPRCRPASASSWASDREGVGAADPGAAAAGGHR
ncbi:hypothetical protein ACFQ2Y_22815 [Streptomyces malaysiensis subsp. malaysiensis]